jgi:hypothetical protein
VHEECEECGELSGRCCSSCGCCPDCCDCEDGGFDRDELGEDPEEDECLSLISLRL